MPFMYPRINIPGSDTPGQLGRGRRPARAPSFGPCMLLVADALHRPSPSALRRHRRDLHPEAPSTLPALHAPDHRRPAPPSALCRRRRDLLHPEAPSTLPGLHALDRWRRQDLLPPAAPSTSPAPARFCLSASYTLPAAGSSTSPVDHAPWRSSGGIARQSFSPTRASSPSSHCLPRRRHNGCIHPRMPWPLLRRDVRSRPRMPWWLLRQDSRSLPCTPSPPVDHGELTSLPPLILLQRNKFNTESLTL
jgi:hypothetical protein